MQARKAFRALKALVKIQALVRGYIVRKQAAATLRSMQALIQVQETVRAKKSHNLGSYNRRKSILDELKTEYNNMYERSSKVVEIDTFRPKITRVYTGQPEEVMDYDWCRYSSTAQSTPRYLNNYRIAPSSPAKSENGDLRRSADYMSSTQSFEAKFWRILEDFVFYWGHRMLHTKWMYKHAHNVHHEYATPFGPSSEYAHPFEILMLGFGIIIGPALTVPHLITPWLWVSLRLMETVEAHSGYDFPWSPSKYLPLHGGSRVEKDVEVQVKRWNFFRFCCWVVVKCCSQQDVEAGNDCDYIFFGNGVGCFFWLPSSRSLLFKWEDYVKC